MFTGAKTAVPKKSAKAAKKAVTKPVPKKATVLKKAVAKPSPFASLVGVVTPTKATNTPAKKAVKKPVKKAVKKPVAKAGPSLAQKAAKQDAENRKIVEQRRVAQRARMFKDARLREGKERQRLANLEKQRKEKIIAEKMAVRKIAAAAKVEAIAREKAKASGKLYTAKVPRLSAQPKIG